jgi:hypothetical protein
MQSNSCITLLPTVGGQCVYEIKITETTRKLCGKPTSNIGRNYCDHCLEFRKDINLLTCTYIHKDGSHCKSVNLSGKSRCKFHDHIIFYNKIWDLENLIKYGIGSSVADALFRWIIDHPLQFDQEFHEYIFSSEYKGLVTLLNNPSKFNDHHVEGMESMDVEKYAIVDGHQYFIDPVTNFVVHRKDNGVVAVVCRFDKKEKFSFSLSEKEQILTNKHHLEIDPYLMILPD